MHWFIRIRFERAVVAIESHLFVTDRRNVSYTTSTTENEQLLTWFCLFTVNVVLMISHLQFAQSFYSSSKP